MHLLYIPKRKSPHGFSLIELLVSLSIFSVVMIASTGALLTLIDVNAKAQALYTATNNLSFALDSITREMRMGYHYHCDSNIQTNLPTNLDTTNDCTGAPFVSFTRERDGWQVGYQFNASNHTIEQKVNNPGGTVGDTGWIPVTSADEIVMTTFAMTVENSSPYCNNTSCTTGTNEEQPTIILHISGYVNNGLDTNTDFNIQTQIVQRRLDLF